MGRSPARWSNRQVASATSEIVLASQYEMEGSGNTAESKPGGPTRMAVWRSSNRRKSDWFTGCSWARPFEHEARPKDSDTVNGHIQLGLIYVVWL
jgi:hypothetical protein